MFDANDYHFSNATNYNDCNRKIKFPTVKMYTILRM
jgi:hypothetical protein